MESPYNYNGRHFIGTINYDDGDFTRDTLFFYREHNDVVWLTFAGGGVTFGTGIARKNNDGSLDIRYQYLNRIGKFISGTSHSIPEVLPDGRYRLRESWRVGEDEVQSGTSVVEEVTGKCPSSAAALNVLSMFH